VEITSALTQSTTDVCGGDSGELTDRSNPPSVERFGDLHVRRQMVQRQRSQEGSLLSGRHDCRGVGEVGCDSGSQFVGGDTDSSWKPGSVEVPNQPSSELSFGRRASEVSSETAYIEKHDAVSAIFDSWRERFGDLEKDFLCGSLAFAVASSGNQPGHQGSRLGQGEPTNDTSLPCQTCRSDDSRIVGVAVEDRQGFVEKLGLAA